MPIVAGVLIVAVVATAADFTWDSFGVRHTVMSGVVHGAAVLTAVGGVLGAAAGRTFRGLPVGAVAGVAGAASYYILIALFGGATYGWAIPAAWVLMWGYLAGLEGRWLRAPQRSWSEVFARGLGAAVLAGLAFSVVQTTLWGRPPEGGRSYLVQWASWAFAWAPGLFALTASTSRVPRAPVAHPEGALVAEAPGDSGSIGSVTGPELLARIDRGDHLHVLDVRFEGEFTAGHIPGAVNVPFMQIGARIDEVPGRPTDELIVYCGHGPRAHMAASALRRAGRTRLTFVTGHWAGWRSAGLRVER